MIIHQHQKKLTYQKEWLSKYCLKIANTHNITTGKVKKLVPNLMDKNNYVIHFRNLQQCLELGMKLKQIHRILKFKQKDWMKPYIQKPQIQIKNSENVPKLESVEVVLVHSNLIKNDYQRTSKVLFSFVSNKQFGQLINISPHSLTMMNTVNTEFSFVEVWFTDQTSKIIEIEVNVNLILIIGQSL